MDKALELRLKLLEEAGEIDSDISKAVTNFVKDVEKKFSIEISEDNGAMLVSHLAMALSRIRKGEEVEGIDEEAFKEVRDRAAYNELGIFYKTLEEQLNISIPDSEKDYIALHVCTLIDKLN